MRLVIIATFLVLLTAAPAFADCTLSATAVCNGVSCANETKSPGSIVYNADHGKLQVCADGSWHALGPGDDPSDACYGVPAPGTVCGDGSVYAGRSPDGNVKMFTTPADAASTKTWNNGQTDWVDTSLANCGSAPACDNSGETNTTTLAAADSDSNDAGVQPHEAAKYCADLSAHGHSDWYLPSAPELNVIYGNKTAIGLFDISGGNYWSSSEIDFTNAWTQNFTDGAQGSSLKHYGYLVRCARR